MAYKITVNASKAYDVLIEGGALAKCGEVLSSVFSPCTVCVVSDTNVAPLYLEKVKNSLKTAGFSVNEFVFAAGEASKTPETICLWGVMAASLAKALSPLKTQCTTIQGIRLFVLQ